MFFLELGIVDHFNHSTFISPLENQTPVCKKKQKPTYKQNKTKNYERDMLYIFLIYYYYYYYYYCYYLFFLRLLTLFVYYTIQNFIKSGGVSYYYI